MARLVSELPRKAPDGLSTREVTCGVIRLKGWDSDDVRFERALCEKVSRCQYPFHVRLTGECIAFVTACAVSSPLVSERWSSSQAAWFA